MTANCSSAPYNLKKIVYYLFPVEECAFVLGEACLAESCKNVMKYRNVGGKKKQFIVTVLGVQSFVISSMCI